MRARVFIIAVRSDEMRRQTWAIPCTNEGLAVSSSESSRRSISRKERIVESRTALNSFN